MHPVSKCCSLYCSCVQISGIIFFGIIAMMLSNHNIFLTRGKTEVEISETKSVLYTTMILNLVVCVSCITCFIHGSRKEKEEEQRRRDEDIRNARDGGLDIFWTQTDKEDQDVY